MVEPTDIVIDYAITVCLAMLMLGCWSASLLGPAIRSYK